MDTNIKKEECFKCKDGQLTTIRLTQLPNGRFEAAYFVGKGKLLDKRFSFGCATEATALRSFDMLKSMFCKNN